MRGLAELCDGGPSEALEETGPRVGAELYWITALAKQSANI